MELEFITVGKIVNTHGIRGEVKLLPQGTEAETVARCRTLYIDGRPHVPAACRVHKGWHSGDQVLVLAAPDGVDLVGGVGEDLLHRAQDPAGGGVPGGEAHQLRIKKFSLWKLGVRAADGHGLVLQS